MSDTMKNPHSKITFKTGDVVRAYTKGIHVITSLDDTPGRSSNGLVKYRKIMNDNFSLCKSKREYSCDIAYCRPVSAATLLEEQKEQNKKYDAAIALVRSLTYA